MSERLEEESRELLEYRPDISFVQPDITSVQPLKEIEVEEDTGLDKLKKLKNFAKNVKTIAEETQKRADKLAEGFEVELNTTTDSACIRALQRHYPGQNPLKVTYEQYLECKRHQKELMENVPDKILNPLKASEIDKAEKALKEGNVAEFLKPVDRITAEADSQMIPPTDVDAVQDASLRALANTLWKNFIKPVIPLPPGVGFLPDEIAPMPAGAAPEEVMGRAHKKKEDLK